MRRRRNRPFKKRTIIVILCTCLVLALIIYLLWQFRSGVRVRVQVEHLEPVATNRVVQIGPLLPTSQPSNDIPLAIAAPPEPAPTPRPITNPTTNLVPPFVYPPKPSPTNALPHLPEPRPEPISAITTSNLASLRLRLPTNTLAILRAQIAMDRMAISSGSLDGKIGKQTRAALSAFQTREGLPISGELDLITKSRLMPLPPVFKSEQISKADYSGLEPLASSWLGKSLQTNLAYESLLESIAEKHHAHPTLIQKLNPSVTWTTSLDGRAILIPNVTRRTPDTKATLIRIKLAERTLQAFDASGRLLAHFPCSIAQRIEKRPVGELRVAVIATNPNYTFDPEVFPESPEAQELGRKLILSPGPNNPVGTVWMGLNKPGYGIHGTPKPEDVGRTESKGCFRLANWNVEYLVKLVTAGPAGTVVRVEP